MKLYSYPLFFLFTIFFIILINQINSVNLKDQLEVENEEEEEKSNYISPPIFSLESGYYNIEEVKELIITSNNTVYYTLDSTDPKTSETAKIYIKPIEMYDRSSDENVYSKCKHEDDSRTSITLKKKFTPGNYPFDKLTVVKAVSQNEEGEFSDIITKIYVVMDSDKLKFYSELPIYLMEKKEYMYVVRCI